MDRDFRLDSRGVMRPVEIRVASVNAERTQWFCKAELQVNPRRVHIGSAKTLRGIDPKCLHIYVLDSMYSRRDAPELDFDIRFMEKHGAQVTWVEGH